MNIAIVVPTIRPEKIDAFRNAWSEQISKHHASLILVNDGPEPTISAYRPGYFETTLKKVMGKYAKLIPRLTDGCRNLGFAYVAKYMPETDIVISLDDDVLPDGDTIGDHIRALNHSVSISWVSTIAGMPVRGVPYGTREEAPVMLSHGWWKGVPDLDAPSQLINGIPDEYSPVKGPIPKGVLFPLCAMNFAFRMEAMPYVYQAPMDMKRWGFDRFADIWSGITLKREFDKKGWAVYTGNASVRHERASNVFKNLQKEAIGIELNEKFWQGDESHPFFKDYAEKRKLWAEFINKQKRHD
jgi:reversibly glycosylated polypeptide/UDP-arabinopyranose mutase